MNWYSSLTESDCQLLFASAHNIGEGKVQNRCKKNGIKWGKTMKLLIKGSQDSGLIHACICFFHSRTVSNGVTRLGFILYTNNVTCGSYTFWLHTPPQATSDRQATASVKTCMLHFACCMLQQRDCPGFTFRDTANFSSYEDSMARQ